MITTTKTTPTTTIPERSQESSQPGSSLASPRRPVSGRGLAVSEEEERGRPICLSARGESQRPEFGRGLGWSRLFGLVSGLLLWLGGALVADSGEEGGLATGPGERAGDQVATPADASAAQRALDFLAREMASWPRENGCYSCHNNGDAARAIYLAMRRERFPVGETVSDAWLKDAEGWQLPEESGPEGDQRLADLQFALAAEQWAEVARKRVRDPQGVERINGAVAIARARVRGGLIDDTHWPADPTSQLGSPVTYGPHLGTAVARQLLGPGENENENGNEGENENTIKNRNENKIESKNTHAQSTWRKSRDWLLAQPLQGTVSAAARILGLTPEERLQYRERVEESRRVLSQAQQDQGGWGPYERSRPENFDTAIAVLALAQLPDEESRQRARKGRKYLIGEQWEDGSWTETTRPGGRESYAQRISTVAWVTIALLESESLERDLE